MTLLTKIKVATVVLLTLTVVLGIITTIAHLVEGKVIRRSIASSQLTQALFVRATTVRLVFVEGDASQVEKLEVVDEKISALINDVQHAFPVQHEAQATLRELEHLHQQTRRLTDQAITTGAATIVADPGADITSEVATTSRNMVTAISQVNAINATDLNRVVRLANVLLLVGLMAMIVIILGGSLLVYRSFARPLTQICDSLERGEYGPHTHVEAFEGGKRTVDEIAKIEAALKVLGKKIALIRQNQK